MLLGIPPNLVYTIITFSLFNISYDFASQLFGLLPIPMGNLINSTLVRYNIPLTDLGISITSSFINGSLNIGFLAALFFLLPLSDSKGRWFTCIVARSISAIISSFFFLASAFTQSLELFILGQIVFGIQGPLRTLSTPLFISECAPNESRGFATLALTLADSAATLLMTALTSPAIFGNVELWFIFPLASLIIAVIGFLMALKVQESPKWLIQQNETEKAKRAVKFFHGACNIDDVVHSMVREKNLTSSDKLSFREVYSDDTLREALKIVVITYAMSWVSPLFAEAIYFMPLHSEAGFTIDQTLQLTLILTIIFSPSRLLGTFFIDKLGRRKLVFAASFVMIFKLILSTLTFPIADIFGPSLLTKMLMIVNDIVIRLFHAIGAGSVGALLISELFPPSARTSVGQCMVFAGLFASMPIDSLFPIIQTYFTAACYIPFLIIHPLILMYLYKYLPETKNRAVYEIIEAMDNNVTSRHASMLSEGTPLINRDRAKSLYNKQAVLRVSRKRSRTMDHLGLFKNESIS